MSATIRALTALFLSLPDDQRSQVIQGLMNVRYAKQIPAMPDPFAIIPDTATPEQVEDIVRGMMMNLTRSLAAGAMAGDMDVTLTGDPSSRLTQPVKITLSSPELMAASFVRKELGGQIPSDLVGVLNLPAADSHQGTYDVEPEPVTGDYPLEGGLLSSIKKGVQSLKKIADTTVGQKILGAAKLVPGLGTVASLAEKGLNLANKVAAYIPDEGKKPSPAIREALPALANKAASLASKGAGLAVKRVKDVLSNPLDIIPSLVATFGEDAVADATLNILANEGDLYDDVVSGAISLPIQLEGDDASWTSKVADLLAAGAEGLEAAVGKATNAGSRAYSKLEPVAKKAWDSPWGKAAAGATAASGAALLYYGVSKALKDKEAQKQATALMLAKKKAAAEEAARKAKLKASQPSVAPSFATSPGSVLPPPPSIPSSLPGGLPTSEPPSFPQSPVLQPSGGSLPGETVVTEKFIKIPFMGVQLQGLADEGSQLLSQWMKSLLKVNPSLISTLNVGDLFEGDHYDYLGSNFLLHGFPLQSIKIAYTADIPSIDGEIALGHHLSSPSLTRRVLQAAMESTGHSKVAAPISIRRSGGWERFTPPQLATAPVKYPRLHPKVTPTARTPKGVPGGLAAVKTAAIGDLLHD